MSVRIDLPFRLFFNRLKNSVARKERQTRLIFEALEDRQLLSVSDPTGVGAATTMIVSSVSAAQLELDSPISLNEADLAAAGDESDLVALSEQEMFELVSSNALADVSQELSDYLNEISSNEWTAGKRWFYFDDGFNDNNWDAGTHTRKENGALYAQIRNAASHGFNGMVWKCYVEDIADRENSELALFLKDVRDYAAARGIEIIPTVWAVGYASLMNYNANYVEGVPVQNVPMKVQGNTATFDSSQVVNHALANSSFESFESGWTPGGNTTAIKSDSAGYSGKSLRIQPTNNDGSSLSQEVELTPNAYYRLTGWVKVSSLTNADSTGELRIYDERVCKDANSGQLKTDSIGNYVSIGFRKSDYQDWVSEYRNDPSRYSNGYVKIVSDVFCALNDEEDGQQDGLTTATVQIRVFGASGDSFWFDEIAIEKVEKQGVVSPIRRNGTPIVVTSADGRTTYVEGRDWNLKDYQGLVYSGGMLKTLVGETLVDADKVALSLDIPAGSSIRNGETILISYYYPAYSSKSDVGRQYGVCLSDFIGTASQNGDSDSLYSRMRETIVTINDILAPKTLFLGIDENRILGTCAADKDSGLSLAQIVGKSVSEQYDIIKDVIPDAEIVVWSDMFDPNHNAVLDYELCNGDLTDVWKYIPNDIIVCCWDHTPIYWKNSYYDIETNTREYMDPNAVITAREVSALGLRFFSERGFRTMGASYYDGDQGDPATNIQDWNELCQATKNNLGIVYTTWYGNDSYNYRYLTSLGDTLNQIKQLTPNTTIASVSLSKSVPVVGQKLTATLSPNANAQTAATYQWYRKEDAIDESGKSLGWQIWKAISGATSATYTPTTVDLGKELKVVAVGVGDYAGTAWKESEAVVANDGVSNVVPAAPSKLVFGDYDFATQTLPMSWKDNSNNETKFVTQFSYDGVKWNRGGETAANVTSRVATGVAPNRKYYFRVAAYNEAGYSDWTFGEYQTPSAVPAAPTKLVFTGYSAKNRTVQMSWTDNSDDETGFVVQYSVDGGLTWRNSAVLGANVTSRVATSISENCVYRFRVAAKNAYGLSEWLEGAYEAADAPNPNLAAPSALVFSDYSSVKKTARMSWTDNSNNETSFVVQYSVDGGFSWRDAATLGKNVTSRVATGLSPGRDYHFRVAAQNAAGRSEWLYGKVGADGVVNENLSAPSALKFSNYSSESQTVKMTWKDNSKDELGFLVQYSVDGGATWRDSATLGANVSTRQASGLVPNRVYNFRVAAFNSDGYSAWVYGEFQTPSQIPAAPRDLVFSGYSPENRTVVMTWKDASTNETGFKVEYSVDGGETWRASANLAANTTSRVATGIVAERKYDFRVAAKNAYGLSEWCYGSFTISNGALTASSAARASAALLAAYEDASLFEDAPTDDYFELLGDAEFSFDDVEF